MLLLLTALVRMICARTAQSHTLALSARAGVHMLINSEHAEAEALAADLNALRRSGQLIFTLSNWMADPKCTSEIRHRWLDIWEQVCMSLLAPLRCRRHASKAMHGTFLAVCKL